jgi:hypothetical protein
VTMAPAEAVTSPPGGAERTSSAVTISFMESSAVRAGGGSGPEYNPSLDPVVSRAHNALDVTRRCGLLESLRWFEFLQRRRASLATEVTAFVPAGPLARCLLACARKSTSARFARAEELN